MSYAGAAANVVGGEMQGWASVLDKQAMFKAYKEELARQQAYRDEGAKLFQGDLNQSRPSYAQSQLDLGRSQREQSYSDIGRIPLSSTSSPTQTSTSAKRDKAFTQMRGQERATLGSYSDWALKQTLNNIQNQEALRQLSNFAAGTAGIFPLKMYKAQHEWDALAEAGAAISSIGGGAANYAQFAQAPQQTGPGGVQNWSSLPLNSQLMYSQGYNYYNNPYSQGYVAPGTFE